MQYLFVCITYGEMDLTDSISTIAARSQFDHIQITGNSYDSRFGTVYEALVSHGGRQQDVAIRQLDLPDSEAKKAEFVDDIQQPLDDWHSVSQSDQILTLFNTGTDPVPWIVTGAAAGTLADRQPMEFVDPLEIALEIVDGVTHLHTNEVIHSGLDPKSIVFTGDSMDNIVKGTALIDAVGLLAVYRYHFEPSAYLDPRYAAPEYFTTEFGTVDHMTDIYQLGSVLYRLFTGDPPYSGTFGEVRDAILTADPPTPTGAGTPGQIDDVIEKAMAKQKLHRYETIEHLRQDLSRIRRDREYE